MNLEFENVTATEEARWNSTPAWKLPDWAEPLVWISTD